MWLTLRVFYLHGPISSWPLLRLEIQTSKLWPDSLLTSPKQKIARLYLIAEQFTWIYMLLFCLLTETGIGFRGEWFKCWKWHSSEKAEMPDSFKSSHEVSTSKVRKKEGWHGTSCWKADDCSRFRLWLWRKRCHVFRKKSFKHKGKQSNGKYSLSTWGPPLFSPFPLTYTTLWWFKLTLMRI